MKTKLLILSIIILVILIPSLALTTDDKLTTKTINYNGNNLKVSIDGNAEDTLPTSGNYYLTDYKCSSSNTIVTWDRTNYKLNITNKNKKSGVSCNLTFKSNPSLSEMPIGSYVSYTGTGGQVGGTTTTCKTNGQTSSSEPTTTTESANSCAGQNAREDLDNSNYTYGYCSNSNYKYYTTGWRLAYVDDSNRESKKPIIISAGSPECISTKEIADTRALKYCNKNLVDGNCTCEDNNNDGLCDEKSTDAWSMNDNDFYNITKEINKTGRKLTTTSSNIKANYCQGVISSECGYGNDILDNGGYYLFTQNQNNQNVYWNPQTRSIETGENKNYGLRPLVRLSSKIVVTNGSGTIDDPYIINTNDFIINNGSSYTNSNTVTLNFYGSNITQICISNTKKCDDYTEFSQTKTWNLTEGTGEKTVYVYYRDENNNLITSMNKKVIVDKTAPSNNEISIKKTSKNVATIKISSTGADYMCLTEENNSKNCNWLSYQNQTTYEFAKKNGSKTIYGFFKDEAGNISSKSLTYDCTTCESTFSANYTFDGSTTIDNINNENIIKINGDWQIDTTNKYLKSNNYNVNNSISKTTITFTPTSNALLSFDYGVSSETNFDKLTITLSSDQKNKTLVNGISGNKTGSITDEALLSGQTYILTLTYQKDNLGNKNNDIGYIKNLLID